MAKTQWVTAACTLAMMAAAPAMAQPATPGATGGSSMPQTAPAQSAAPATTAPAPMGSGQMESGQMSQGAGTSGKMHHAMGSHMHHPMRAARGSDAQNEAVDKLNEQSFQAAQQGQSFNGTSTSMGTMSNDSSGGMSGAPGSMGGGSGGMGAMPGGSAGTPSGGAGMSGGKM